VQEDCSCEVLLIAEAVCGVLDLLDLGVAGFAGSVSDAVAEIGKAQSQLFPTPFRRG